MHCVLSCCRPGRMNSTQCSWNEPRVVGKVWSQRQTSGCCFCCVFGFVFVFFARARAFVLLLFRFPFFVAAGGAFARGGCVRVVLFSPSSSPFFFFPPFSFPLFSFLPTSYFFCAVSACPRLILSLLYQLQPYVSVFLLPKPCMLCVLHGVVHFWILDHWVLQYFVRQ